ncbi:hypothetical protein JTB14_017045 [Gonioctena quinquepunctata]|nr:hypothetical protein JTB14_017045 [Gonioctena quinquepunctata]
MNEFVRRPSRRRDTRVYVPAADIIKRTIRRSWTISNPTPIRWNILRGSPELRPYNSLPRGQDINNYPSLAIHQANLRNKQNSQKISADSSPSPPYRRRSPARRTHSEDIYSERENSSIVRDSSPVSRGGSPIVRGSSPIFLKDAQPIVSSQKGMRVNPLMRLVENKQAREGKRSPKRMQNNEGSSEEGSSKEEEIQKSKGIPTPEPTKKSDFILEKRVSFESNINLTNTMMKDRLMVALRNQAVKEARLLEDGKMLERRSSLYHSHQGDQSDNSEESGSTSNELHYAREETAPIETCDIEPISGTVFRKVTVRRRHQESVRKISPVESGKSFSFVHGDYSDIAGNIFYRV